MVSSGSGSTAALSIEFAAERVRASLRARAKPLLSADAYTRLRVHRQWRGRTLQRFCASCYCHSCSFYIWVPLSAWRSCLSLSVGGGLHRARHGSFCRFVEAMTTRHDKDNCICIFTSMSTRSFLAARLFGGGTHCCTAGCHNYATEGHCDSIGHLSKMAWHGALCPHTLFSG